MLRALLHGIACLSFALLGASTAFAADKRVALVIGNSAYQHTSALANPANDASDVATALEQLGFRVTQGLDLDKAAMDRTIRRFAQALESSEVGVFFYAGHGLQVDGKNYLVPTDAKLEDGTGLDFELIRLDLVQHTMERGTQTNILFLDACRNNPLARNLARAMGTRSASIGTGLAPVESGVGTLVSFSTQPGNVALDGDGRNSPFSGALVQQLLSDRGGDLADLLINVRRDVMQTTKNRQVPWEHSALTKRFYFSREPSAAAAPQAGLSYEQQTELAFWNAVKDSKQASVVRSYIEAYPKGAFVPLAKAIAAGLEPAGPAADPAGGSQDASTRAPGPFDGSWTVSANGNKACPRKSGTFPIRIENGVIGGWLRQPGKVDDKGSFAFERSSVVDESLVVKFSGTLKGNAGTGRYRTVGHACEGTTVLQRVGPVDNVGDARQAPSRK